MLRRTALLAVLISTPAVVQAGDRIVQGLCDADRCDRFEILSALPYTKNEEGTLIQTSLKTVRTRATDAGEAAVENGYVFCSLTRPAIIAVKGERAMAYLLAPLAPGQTPESVRAEANQHAVYFGVCHGTEAGTAAATDPEAVATDYGYRVTLLVPQQVALRKPEDIMQAQPSSEGRRAPRVGRPLDEAGTREVPPVETGPAAGLPEGFDDRLDRFLGQGARRSAPTRPDAPYEGPFVDDAWLPPRR